MNLADLKYYADTQVDTPYLARLVAAQPSLEGISAFTGGSTLSMASPRQQREAQAIRGKVQPVVNAAKNAVTDPYYAMTPGMDQRRQDARRRILEKVAAVATDPMAATFAGVGAKMVDKAALARSLEMKAAGVPDREIWKQTGWTHGFPDGKPRFEIDDSAAAYAENMPTFGRLKENRPLSDSFNHTELYENYPFASRLTLSEVNGGALGSYDEIAGALNVTGLLPPKKYMNKRQFRNAQEGITGTTTHELQHAIQQQEDFARGGSPNQAWNAYKFELQDSLKPLQAKYEDAQILAMQKPTKANIATAQQAENEYYAALSVTNREIQKIKNDPYDNYQALAGEVEARLTQRRMSLNAEQRRQRYPIEDMDIPVEDQIVRFK